MSAPHASPMVTRDPNRSRIRIYAEPAEITEDVFLHAAFVNSWALKTPEGLLLVDPGLGVGSGSVRDAVRGWSAEPLRAAVYTHGHADHAFGLRAFLADGERPEIIAQQNCLERFRRYELTWGWNARINQRQFSLAEPTFPRRFDWPTHTFRDTLLRRFGDLEVEFHAAKGETDDACIVWIPERKQLFTGDLVMWQAPNCGNPQKVQRYPVEWAEALEKMAGFGAEWLFPGHGLAIQGEAAIRRFLLETAQYLRHLIDQVLERMNRGETPEQIFHAVEPHPELSQRTFLQPNYDHPKFIVRNLLRLWGGWWNGNAADLLPATHEAQAAEVAALAGGVEAIVERGRKLLAEGKSALAAHHAEWAARAEPGHRGAQELKRDVYDRRREEEPALMSKGIYRAAGNDARAALGEEPIAASSLMHLGEET